MRNLKKILSLALALVMVFSLMTFASAKDFGDADSVDHTEAANVLSALGIVDGYEDGNFYPDRVVKRGEMAKMIAFIVNGGKDPVLNPAEVSYTDTANHWAKGYIEYCTGLGIVSGYGDGTFKPDNTVTGTEAAKMLLIAMGYNSDIREYTGPSWSLNVGVDANQKDLYKDLTYVNPSNGLDRDATAQMVYNCLNAKGVYRSDSIGVQDGKVTYNYTDDIYTVLYRKMNVARVEGVVVGNEYATLTANGTNGHEQAGKTAIVVTNYDELRNVNGSNANTILTVSNQNSFSAPVSVPASSLIDTFAVSTGKDELGKAVILFARPASNTKSPEKATVIGSVVLDENTVMEKTGKWSKQSKMDDALRAAGLKTDVPSIYYVNGEAIASKYTYDNAAAVNKAGYRTQFIDFDLDGKVDFVLVDQVDFGKVSIKSTKSAGSMTIATGSANVKRDDSKDVVGFDAVEQGDYVLYAEVGGRLYVEKAETISGKLTDYSKQVGDSKAEDNLWVDGVKYTVSGADGHNCDGSKLTDPSGYDALDKEATFYLDACGFIVAVDGTGTQKFALATYYNANAYNEGGITTSKRAQVTFEDGTSSAPKVSSATGDTLNSALSVNNFAANAVLGSYSYNSDDELVLSVPAKNGSKSNADGTFKYVSGNILVTIGGANLQAGSPAKNLYMTNNTVVFFVETEANGAISNSKADKVTVYTGKDSTPGIELDRDFVVKYVYNDDNEILAMAVISGSISAVADNYLYLIKIIRSATKVKTGLAVIDGEIREIVIDAGADTAVEAKKAYEYSTTASGSLKLKDISDSKLAGKFSVEQVNTNDNTVVVRGVEYKVTNKTVIANLADEETLSLSGLNKGDIVTVLFDTSGSDKTALGIYIHETIDPSSANLASVILGTEGGAAGTIVSSTSGTKTNSNAAGRYDLEVNTSITGDQLKAALVIPEGATATVYTTWDNIAANDPTTEITGALTADGSTVYFVQIVSKDHSTKKVYEFTADVYTAPAEQIPYDTANIETVISTTLATKDAVEITGGALALTGTLTIADGKTLTVKTGGITGNQSVEVTGTLVVEAGGVAGSLDIKAGGTAAVTGAVTTVTDVAATGTATITGTVTTVTDNNGTLNVTGNITTVSDNNGTLTVSGSGNKIVTLANAAKGAITADIDTVENITAAAETVTITGNINTELRNVTSGTLNVSGTVAKVTNITDGTVTINGAVGEVTDITDGTITFKDDVADVKDISGGTVKFEKGATIGGAAVLGTAAIQLTTADSTLTLGTASEVINIAGLTGLTGVANAKVVVASSAVTVAANQLYSAADTAVGAGVVGQTGNYIMNAAGTQFVYTA